VTRTRDPIGLGSDASGAHPDHHLWRNGRIWWVAFTFHTSDGRKHRVRRTLATSHAAEARLRRDALLAEYARQPGWRLALRFVAREPEPDADGLSPHSLAVA
jgi:hypothetical protein